MPKISWPTIIKLGIASLIVGTLLGVTGANPLEFWERVWDWSSDTVKGIFGAGFDGVVTAGRYTLIGAGVVIPIWIVMKLWGLRSQSSAKKSVEPKTSLER